MKTVFLDRDGVVNRDRFPTVMRLEDVEILPGALDAIAALRKAGHRIFIVTNKTAVGWGLLPFERHEAINRHIVAAIEAAGGKVEKVYACTHNHLQACDCRKPKPGMLLAAKREFGVDPKESWMVGDKATDVAAGAAFGARTIRIVEDAARREAARTATPRPDFVVASLAEAVDLILKAH